MHDFVLVAIMEVLVARMEVLVAIMEVLVARMEVFSAVVVTIEVPEKEGIRHLNYLNKK